MPEFKETVAEFNKEMGAKADHDKAKLDELESHAKQKVHNDSTAAIADARKLHAKIDSQRNKLVTAPGIEGGYDQSWYQDGYR